jgi:hypothetical protein
MARQLGSCVGFEHVRVDLLGQLVLGKLGEGAAEGGFAGNFAGTFPAAKLAQQRAGLQGVKDTHLSDLAFQCVLLKKMGVPVRRSKRRDVRLASKTYRQDGERRGLE